jgi:AraC-like DNA-binding protein
MMCGVHERTPHPLLRKAVLRYAGFEQRASAPVRRIELPQDRVSVIVNLGDPFEVDGTRHGSFVAPVDDRPALTGFERSARGVQIDLTPFAARALLGVPLDALGGALAVDLRDVLGRDAAELEERLDAAPGWEARFALLDGVLARRLAGADAAPPDAAHAWARLQSTAGAVRIGALAAELGCSRRHLAARFREHVGVPPKTVARILRFRRALALLRGGADPAAAAYASGYADQPHLNREFRALAGATPVTFVQDRGAGVT